MARRGGIGPQWRGIPSSIEEAEKVKTPLEVSRDLENSSRNRGRSLFDETDRGDDGGRGVPPPTDWVTPDSSRVLAMRFVPSRGEIQVVFHNARGRSGPQNWVYSNCDEGDWSAMAVAPSVGEYINANMYGNRGGKSGNGEKVVAFLG